MNDTTGIPLSCGSFVGTNAPNYVFKKLAINGDKFYLRANPSSRVTNPATSGIIPSDDRLFSNTSGVSTIIDYNLSIEYSTNESSMINMIYSTNSGVLTVSNMYASGISYGDSTIVAKKDDYFSAVDVNTSGVIGSTTSTFVGYVNNSLAKHVSDAIDNRTNGTDPNIAKNIYTTQNHSSGIYVRNSGCWASDLDLTCISPWNSTDQQWRAGTLISPRHIIFATHYQINTGATIRFVDNSNNIVTRTMTNKTNITNTDFTIGVLDSNVPNTISFAKILPQNSSSYLPSLLLNGGSLGITYTVPCLRLDYEEKALISDLSSLDRGPGFLNALGFTLPILPNRLNYFENIISGDSGNPIFLIINNSLVILTTITGGLDGSVVYYKESINSAMSQLGGGYSLTEIDLGSFPLY